MQHDHVLTKLTFDLNPRVVGWGQVGDCGQNIYFHAASLRDCICTLTSSEKVEV